MLKWWDHHGPRSTSNAKYGAGRPIIIGGFSWGAWQALTIALGRTDTLIGYFCSCPTPTLFENITAFNDPGFFPPPCTSSPLGPAWTCPSTV